MYLILVYDAKPKRGVKLLKFLRKHLIWIQNSVFEGEVTDSQFEIIKKGVKDIIKQEEDSIIYYKLASQNYTNRGVIGLERNETSNIL